MTVKLDKQSMRRVVHMVETQLVTSRHVKPWACQRIAAIKAAPAWLCELAMVEFKGDLERVLREFVHSPPFESFAWNFNADYKIACLYLRFERGEMAWAGFLRAAGETADCEDAGTVDCEYYYAMLNELEEREFSKALAGQQEELVTALLKEVIPRLREDYAPFAEARSGSRQGRA